MHSKHTKRNLIEIITHNVVRDDKFPNEGGNWPLKLFPDRSLHHNIWSQPWT